VQRWLLVAAMLVVAVAGTLCMPRNLASTNPTGAAVHSTIHTDTY
jgi:hypothetical protein